MKKIYKSNYKLSIAIFATILHIASAIFIENIDNTNIVIVFSFSVYIPVILFGILYDIKGGLISSISLVIFNAILDFGFNPPVFNTNIYIAWYLTYILSGLMVGYITNLNKKLTKTLNQREVILKESNHRISNSLALIINLIRLQSRSLDSQDKKALVLLKDLEKRIESIGLIHNQLFKSSDFNKIDFYNYITDLSDSIISSFIENKDRIKIFVNIIKVELPPDILIPIGLIVTEIIINAIKYGFPDNKSGDIKIMLAKNKSNYTLEISNNGELLPDDFDLKTNNTLGMRITKSLVDQLDGEISVNNEKEVKFTINFTL